MYGNERSAEGRSQHVNELSAGELRVRQADPWRVFQSSQQVAEGVQYFKKYSIFMKIWS